LEEERRAVKGGSQSQRIPEAVPAFAVAGAEVEERGFPCSWSQASTRAGPAASKPPMIRLRISKILMDPSIREQCTCQPAFVSEMAKTA
jgi:hypothetical protein